MELITPTTTSLLVCYDHPVLGKYAAITRNTFGKDGAMYIGCRTGNEVSQKVLGDALKTADLWAPDQAIAFPILTKSGTNSQQKTVRYYFNYAATASTFSYPHAAGIDLLTNQSVSKNQSLNLDS